MRLALTLLRSARIAALLTLSCLIVLFASAGMLLENSAGRNVHGAAAVSVHVTTGILALALLARAYSARVGLGMAAVAVVLFALTFIQAALGSYMTLALHVSGSLLLVVLTVWITFWTFTNPKRWRTS